MPEPDVAADYDDENPRRLSPEARLRMAEALGKDIAYVDALIERMGAGWADRDPDHDIPEDDE